MSLDLAILASGSSGNCSVVRSSTGAILIDAGIGPRTADRRMAALGLRLDQIAGVCLTHLDSDHLSANLLAWLTRHQVPIFCHRDKLFLIHRIADRRCIALKNVHGFGDVPFEPIAGVSLQPVAVEHDETGSHAFVIGSSTTRIGFATDLGRVPYRLIDAFTEGAGLDVLAMESNYCPLMQAASNRPLFLKRRIMGGHGHLSNQQTFEAVRRILDRHTSAGNGLPGSIALLHRSRECNCPMKVREIFSRDVRIAKRLVLAEQSEPTGWLVRREAQSEQMRFAWG